jgi:hypothetical protein
MWTERETEMATLLNVKIIICLVGAEALRWMRLKSCKRSKGTILAVSFLLMSRKLFDRVHAVRYYSDWTQR